MSDKEQEVKKEEAQKEETQKKPSKKQVELEAAKKQLEELNAKLKG